MIAASMAAGYVGGRAQGWSSNRETQLQLRIALQEHERAFDTVRAEHVVELARVRSELDRTQRERRRAREFYVLYEGYRSLQRSLSALEEHRIPTAQADLRTAQRLLAPLAPHVENVAKLVESLSSTDLTDAQNAGADREKLMSLLRQLDVLLGDEVAAHEGRSPG